MAKLTAGVGMSHVPAIGAAADTGMTADEYAAMMRAGGRSPHGNRSIRENG